MKNVIVFLILILISVSANAEGICDSLIQSSYSGEKLPLSETKPCVADVLSKDISVKSIWLLFPNQVSTLLPSIISFFSDANVYDESFSVVAKEYAFMDIVYQAFNFVAFFVGLILFSMFLIKEIKAGATQGAAFGGDKEGNGYYATKNVLGFFLLAPVAGGFTMGQYFVIFCALIGISFAVFIWVAFMMGAIFLTPKILNISAEFDKDEYDSVTDTVEVINKISLCDIETREVISSVLLDEATSFNSCLKSNTNNYFRQSASGGLIYDPLSVVNSCAEDNGINLEEDFGYCGSVQISNEYDAFFSDFENAVIKTRDVAYKIKTNYCLDSLIGENNNEKKNDYSCLLMNAGGDYAISVEEDAVQQISSSNSSYSSKDTIASLNDEIEKEFLKSVNNNANKSVVENMENFFNIGWLSTTVLFYKVNEISSNFVNNKPLVSGVSYEFSPYNIKNVYLKDRLTAEYETLKTKKTEVKIDKPDSILTDMYFDKKTSKDFFSPDVLNQEDFGKLSSISLISVYTSLNMAYEKSLLATLGFNVAEATTRAFIKEQEAELNVSKSGTRAKDGSSTYKNRTTISDPDIFEARKEGIIKKAGHLLRFLDIVGAIATFMFIFILLIVKGIPLFLMIFFFSIFISYLFSIFKLFIMVPAFGFQHIMDAKTKSLSGSYNYIYSGMLNLTVRPVIMMLAFLSAFLLINVLGSLAYYLVFSIGDVALKPVLGGNFLLDIIASSVVLIMYLVFLIYISYKSIKIVYKIPNDADKWLNLETDPDGFWNKFIEMSSSWFMARLNSGMLR